MLATDPPVLSLRAETSPVCGIDLTAPLQSFVAADTDKGMLVLEFRQQQMGQTVRLLFKTEAQPLIDAASDSVLAQEAFAGLSRLSVPCPAVPSADAMRLLRSIRWVLRAHDNERWS